jgi:peptidoglycan hydrolase-like protein with peptidoglycan-binding domain
MRKTILLLSCILFILSGCKTVDSVVEAVNPEPIDDSRTLTRSELKEVQQLLADNGYSPGLADGITGKKTTAAISEYQRDAGLKVDGKPKPSLLAALRDTPQTRPTDSQGDAPKTAAGRELNTQDSTDSPEVVYYKMIPKTLTEYYIACEKSVSERRRINGMRPVEITTSKADFFKEHVTSIENYFSGWDAENHMARTEIDQCVQGRRAQEMQKNQYKPW